MHLKHFTTRLAPENLHADQDAINRFLDTVTVKKTSTQFVPGNPDYWSILVFYENGQEAKPKEAGHEAKPKETVKGPELTMADLTETEQSIVSALKIWRKDRATEMNIPEFMVCHNATLMTLARERPHNIDGLSKIKGLGDQKIARYGDDIVAILNAF